MSEPKRPEIGASSIARIAGNILSGIAANPNGPAMSHLEAAKAALDLAEFIAREAVIRARKAQEPETPEER